VDTITLTLEVFQLFFKKNDWFDVAFEKEPGSPINPKCLAGQISKHKPKGAIVTKDGGNSRF